MTNAFYLAIRVFSGCLLFLSNEFVGAQSNKGPVDNPGVYQPPGFADANRIQKMAAAYKIIDSLFREHAARNHFPGMVYGIIADGSLVHTGSIGYIDERKKIIANEQSVFRIASMSKSFTGMAMLKLRDAGKLNLDDPVSKYIPEMNQVRYLTTDAPPITIRNLLSHSAGFPEDNPWGDRQLADPDAALLKLITDGVNFSTVPATIFEYSNLGFALAGLVITKVSGMPYQLYITENILRPLGMSNTYYEYEKVPRAQLALGYRWINNAWRDEPMLHDGSYGSMGGMLTSIEDFAKYMALYQSSWPPNNAPESKVIKRSSLREMYHPWMFAGVFLQNRSNGKQCAVSGAYGFGLGWSMDCDGKTTVGHSGGLPGFGSQWVILPEYGIGVVSFANRTYAGTGGINLRVMDTLISLAGLKPMQLPPSSILNQRKSELLKLLPDWKNAEHSQLFAENFFQDYLIDSLKKQAATIFSNAGKIVQVRQLIPDNQLRGKFIMEGEKKNIEIFFTLTPENPPLIQEYRIREILKN